MRRSASRLILFATVAVTVAGGVVVNRHMAVPVGEVTSSPVSDHAAGVSQRLSALFVGDSFTVGAGVAGAANGYACILARSQGWACNVDAFGATGYLNDGAGFYPTPPGRALDRLSADVKLYAVDMVVLDSGRNDLGKDPAAVVDAFTQTLAEVQQLWPSARVVVIMPAYMSATPYTNYSLVHTGFVAACGAAHATLLDPVAEQWYSGVDIEGMQIPDHVHPNALGNQFLAGKIADSMARHGLGDLVGARVPS